MVTVERIRDDSEKRILRCSEGNSFSIKDSYEEKFLGELYS